MKTATFKLPEYLTSSMEITSKNIVDFLKAIGFKTHDGEEKTYSKTYHKDYIISIKLDFDNFRKSKIDYGREIRRDRETTTNFSQSENFVILECVNRLLEKGYKPSSIILEKDWKLGHREKGCLDIQVLDKDNESFLMIECKTWNEEYKKERNKMYENGGQLFSYFIQDKKTEYLCLYASVFDSGKIIYENSVVKTNENMNSSSNILECFESWKPQIFEEGGIFEKNIQPYKIDFLGLLKSDLKPLTKEDGGDIFNRFAEILRKNVVSDKTNAYNKIFNLFLCKIVDEYERRDDEILKFQWSENETNEEVLLRLNSLYKKGMKEYLHLNISSIDIEEIKEGLHDIKTRGDKEKLIRLFIEQKLYTSNDFAFKEVFDKNTFDLNCIVVKEVVKLLEKYKIKYETKQQFLGDFFEKLLNTGIKQEVGQFFTPVPIAQFMCKSLPLLNIIEEKNNNEEINILPYCIDYSSGSGHFLTEIMEEINKNIDSLLDKDYIKNRRAKKELERQRDNFYWAGEYIYGIEKDYRLAKTTKIATFLNGDGDATVICGDGLDNFSKSKDYRKNLILSDNKQDNPAFDVVIANPPYSVSGFKTTLPYGKESFELFDNFSDKSNEIECLFIERTKQLLRNKGVAGIVLPTSILEGGKIYSKVRELILDNFELKSIVQLGKRTFMATDTITVILFLKKIESKKEHILHYIKKSLNEKKDLSNNQIDSPVKKYLDSNYKISLNDYWKMLLNEDVNNEELIKIKPYNEYVSNYSKKGYGKLSKYVIDREINKLLYFITTFGKKVVIYKVPSDNTKEQKMALGYEFSDRRGYEGINIFNLGGDLYNPNNLDDQDKVNSYILKNFHNELQENEEGIENMRIISLNEIIDFKDSDCSKIININQLYKNSKKQTDSAKKAILKMKEEKLIIKLSEVIKKYKTTDKEIKDLLAEGTQSGGTPATRNQDFWKDGKINWLKIGDMNEKYITNTEKKITEEGAKAKNLRIFGEDTVLFSIFATIGKVGILRIATTINQAICALIPDRSIVLPEYLYYILLLQREKISERKIHRTQDNLNKTKLETSEVPLITDIEEQKKFITEIKKFEDSL